MDSPPQPALPVHPKAQLVFCLDLLMQGERTDQRKRVYILRKGPPRHQNGCRGSEDCTGRGVLQQKMRLLIVAHINTSYKGYRIVTNLHHCMVVVNKILRLAHSHNPLLRLVSAPPELCVRCCGRAMRCHDKLNQANTRNIGFYSQPIDRQNSVGPEASLIQLSVWAWLVS